MAFEAKKSAAYSEPEKIRARRDALAHAVSMLTDKRDDVAIVPADYIDRVHKALLENDFDREHVKYFNTPLISEWQDLRSGVIGAKSPRDLTVAYLAGPEPLNDFDELVRLGVHPYNIWAFESEDVAFQSGLESIKSSHFPLLKLQKGNIDTFFQAVPRTFDLIYIDACGPLPSAGQRTLRTIANIFRYGRLSSPGVLITNFACPDVTNQQQRDAYAEFVSAYLWPKGCLESGDTEWNLDDGANAHSLSSMRIEGELWFTDKVREDFEFYYGQYITRQIFDVASFVAPWTRFANSDMWKSLFTVDPKSLAVRAAAFQHFAEDHDGGGGDFIVDPDMYAIGWTPTALANTRDGNYPFFFAGLESRA